MVSLMLVSGLIGGVMTQDEMPPDSPPPLSSPEQSPPSSGQQEGGQIDLSVNPEYPRSGTFVKFDYVIPVCPSIVPREGKDIGRSRYEEYRGFVIQGSHQRTNPNVKDVFIYVPHGLDISGFATLGFTIHLVRRGEFEAVFDVPTDNDVLWVSRGDGSFLCFTILLIWKFLSRLLKSIPF